VLCFIAARGKLDNASGWQVALALPITTIKEYDRPVATLDEKKSYYWVLAGASIFGLPLKLMLYPAKPR